MRVDAHQHFWNNEAGDYPWLDRPENAAINCTFGPDMLAPLLGEAGIDRTVLVQAMDSAKDTESMLVLAAENAWIGGVVGWVPLDNPDAAGKRLETLLRNTKFKGVRHLIHEEADPDWVVRDVVIEGLKVLAAMDVPFDVVAVFPNHLKHVPELAERVPNLRMVIDHLAKPPIKSKAMDDWKQQMVQAAGYPQVYAKVSGLNTAADWNTWTAQDFEPYIDVAFEHFGANRLMFGSDWPVATLAGTYRQVWDATRQVVARYGPEAELAIFGDTAAQFYRLAGVPS